MDAKFVFDGENIVTGERLRIVKDGDYAITKEGLESALFDGMVDKNGANAEVHDFSILVLEPKPSKNNVIAYSLVMRKMPHTGKGSLGTFVGEVRCRPY